MLFVLLVTSQLYSQSFEKAWETDTLLSKPESAVFDRVNQVIYVSNVCGDYCTKDGNGFISKISLNGKIEVLKWVDGLDSPQGLALFGQTLYVADVDKIVTIDTQTGTKVCEYIVEGAKFLNDATTDSLGNAYFTDCKTNKIHMLSKNEVSVWLSYSLLKSPNGILWSGNNLLVLNMRNGIVYKIDGKEKMFRQFSTGIKNCDGITSDGEGGFFVSGAWQGEVFHLNKDGEKQVVLDLGKEKTIVADISYIVDKGLLLIPTLYKTLQAYSCE